MCSVLWRELYFLVMAIPGILKLFCSLSSRISCHDALLSTSLKVLSGWFVCGGLLLQRDRKDRMSVTSCGNIRHITPWARSGRGIEAGWGPSLTITNRECRLQEVHPAGFLFKATVSAKRNRRSERTAKASRNRWFREAPNTGRPVSGTMCSLLSDQAGSSPQGTYSGWHGGFGSLLWLGSRCCRLVSNNSRAPWGHSITCSTLSRLQASRLVFQAGRAGAGASRWQLWVSSASGRWSNSCSTTFIAMYTNGRTSWTTAWEGWWASCCPSSSNFCRGTVERERRQIGCNGA